MKGLVALLIIAGCSQAPVQLDPKAGEIEVVVHKPNGCKTVGKVVGEDETGSKEMALNSALNKAAALGATSLHVNQEVPNGKLMVVHATAYKCD